MQTLSFQEVQRTVSVCMHKEKKMPLKQKLTAAVSAFLTGDVMCPRDKCSFASAYLGGGTLKNEDSSAQDRHISMRSKVWMYVHIHKIPELLLDKWEGVLVFLETLKGKVLGI